VTLLGSTTNLSEVRRLRKTAGCPKRAVRTKDTKRPACVNVTVSKRLPEAVLFCDHCQQLPEMRHREGASVFAQISLLSNRAAAYGTNRRAQTEASFAFQLLINHRTSEAQKAALCTFLHLRIESRICQCSIPFSQHSSPATAKTHLPQKVDCQQRF
jgi:hypothetical protein